MRIFLAGKEYAETAHAEQPIPGTLMRRHGQTGEPPLFPHVESAIRWRSFTLDNSPAGPTGIHPGCTVMGSPGLATVSLARTGGASYMHTFPVFLESGQVVASMGFDVLLGAGAGVTMKAGIYESDSTYAYPGALVLETADIDVNVVAFQTAAVNWIVPYSGMYWFNFRQSAGGAIGSFTAIETIAAAGGGVLSVGVGNTGGFGPFQLLVSASYNFGYANPAPDPYPQVIARMDSAGDWASLLWWVAG